VVRATDQNSGEEIGQARGFVGVDINDLFLRKFRLSAAVTDTV